jgi:glutathione gamma-glutamylcysteinyltransferase
VRASMAAAGRRLPSSLATYARECARFRAGQRCATCPEAATTTCPLPDIENVPAHLLPRATVPAGGGVAMQCHRVTTPGVAGVRAVPHRACSASAARELERDAAPSPLLAITVERKPPMHGPIDRGEPLSSKAGRDMFREALAADTLRSYFTLSEQMVYQPDASLRPVTCLAVVLNALRHDPHKTWKPIWRWNTEEVLLDQEVGRRGLTAEAVRNKGGLKLQEMAELARNNGARAQAYPASPALPFGAVPLLSRPNGEDSFRRRVKAVCSREVDGEEHLVVRHFSHAGKWAFAPVSGYHEASDSVLLLDLDRAMAPRWVPLKVLWVEMCSAAEGALGGFIAVGAMSSAPRTSSVPEEASCPRLLRSWGESKLVEEPVSEAPMAALQGRLAQQAAVANSFGELELCPLVVWAAATRPLPVTRRCGSHAKRLSRSAMRRGSAAPKARSRGDAGDGRREAVAWGQLLQWHAAQGRAQDIAVGGGRAVHSSLAHKVAPVGAKDGSPLQPA